MPRLFLESPHQLRTVQVAQLRRQCGQRHFAEAALVIAGHEGDQLPPGRIQGGQLIKCLDNGTGLDIRRRGRRMRPLVPHHAQHPALPQGNAHQRARRQQSVMHVMQGRGRKRTMCRQRHQYGQPVLRRPGAVLRPCSRWRHGSKRGRTKCRRVPVAPLAAGANTSQPTARCGKRTRPEKAQRNGTA